MFDSKIYIERRKKLKEQMKTGLIFFPGNSESPMNYPDNTYHFRQDSDFLYYFGLDEANLAAVIDIDNNKEIIFGNDLTLSDIIWMGPAPKMAEKAALVGVKKTMPLKKLETVLKNAKSKKQKIHFLPQYRAQNKIWMEELIGIKTTKTNAKASEKLIKAVVSQREIKSAEEVEQMEMAVEISYEMNLAAMQYSEPGLLEQEIFGLVEGIALSMGNGTSFPIIYSIHPETLHNHKHGNIMSKGDILVLDSGAESPLHYASDITRTFPVNGKFSPIQKALYEIVLKANTEVIAMMKPGLPHRDCHMAAVKIIAQGMKDLGYMKGNVDEAVKAGAHALFMPHGLGHQIGLDVHDMEGLGENYVGYDSKYKRSKQFGTAYLRMGKELKVGHAMTVEPGLYFIPELIHQWKAKKLHSNFINYNKVVKDIGIGGFRIEDDVIITEAGAEVIGPHIPKTVKEVEKACKL